MMASLIQKIAKLAHHIFSNMSKDKSFADNLTKLNMLVKEVRKEDVGLRSDQLDGPAFQRQWTRGAGAPVTYVEIYEDDVFSLGIFILKNGARIPLHDHPGMHGIIKVIHGTISVQSYTAAVDGEEGLLRQFKKFGAVVAKKLPPTLVDETLEPCCLAPHSGNFHEIKAVGGPAAFVDILAPPYDFDDDRQCRFYREADPRSLKAYFPQGLLRTISAGESSAAASAALSSQTSLMPDVALVECGQPRDYWSDSLAYSGPKIRL